MLFFPFNSSFVVTALLKHRAKIDRKQAEKEKDERGKKKTRTKNKRKTKPMFFFLS